MSAANSIKVVARFRPQNKIELESGGKPIVRFDSEDTCTLDVRALPFALCIVGDSAKSVPQADPDMSFF
jgi:hypothetical protein